MIPGSPTAIDTESIVDPALHHEIKCRAYELYERHGNTVEGRDSHDELQPELPRIDYAPAQLQKYLKVEVGDTRAVAAARVYLRALTAFIAG
jgi:hypothetical protein